MPYLNNKDADETAHLCSLISAFVVHHPDSIIPIVAVSQITSVLLSSVSEQVVCILHGHNPPKAGFLMAGLI